MKSIKSTIFARGVSMIEVLITLLILSVGLLGLATLQGQALKGTFDSAQRSTAMWLAQELAERMRANATAAADYVAASAASTCPAPTAPAPAKLCSDYNTGSAKVNAANNCSTTEVAQFDFWEVACGYNNGVNIKSNSSDFVDLNSISITCLSMTAGACNSDSDYSIQVQWNREIIGNSLDESGIGTANIILDVRL